jgi:phage repressor protein C with HTH and peptisase S24 domain
MNDINLRIKELIEKEKLSVRAFTTQIGTSNGVINKVLKQETGVSVDTILRIIDKFKLNANWLLTGQGEMYLADAQPRSEVKVLTTTVDAENNEKIVLVPEKAEAGYLKSFENEGLMVDFLKKLPVISLPGSEYHNASFRAFEVSGHSMEPTFYPRDIVVCRYIESANYIRNKEIYIIVTRNEGIIIKRVVKKDSMLELHSDNEEYDPYTIDLQEIVEIWKFEARISKVAPMPRRRLKAIEEGLNAVQQQLTLQFKIMNKEK